jgi:hypothetical protein
MQWLYGTGVVCCPPMLRVDISRFPVCGRCGAVDPHVVDETVTRGSGRRGLTGRHERPFAPWLRPPIVIDDNEAVSFDLVVLALSADNDADSARRLFKQCTAVGAHNVGEPDRRIVAFYEELQSIYPDHGPTVEAPDCPWNSVPLSVGIDHVIMHLGFGPRTTPAIETLMRLASHHGLAVYDPQGGDVYLA